MVKEIEAVFDCKKTALPSKKYWSAATKEGYCITQNWLGESLCADQGRSTQMQHFSDMQGTREINLLIITCLPSYVDWFHLNIFKKFF